MRIYEPDQNTLAALRDSNIELILDVPNSELGSLQSDASQWVETNVIPFFPATKIRYIAVGNEVDPDKESSRFVPLVLPAMESIHRALSNRGLQDQIKVSTATYSAILKDSYPPSKSSFKNSFMTPIVAFLARNGSPLLANIYPYFAYIGDTRGTTPLDYALFTSPGVVVRDNGLEYKNLFGAMVDGMYYALEKAGGAGIGVVVSESGWPSGGGGASETVANAEAYYRNLIGSVGGGTPKKPGVAVESYLFAMFDENEKPGDPTEQHFGLFSPEDKTPKYKLGFKSA